MKDAYYFSHDSNAKDDPKCVLLIDQLGLEGYGIYWVLLETLRDQPDYRYPLNLVSALARRYNTTSEKMMTVIKNYNLFEVDEENLFFSKSFLLRMSHIDALREKRRKAGIVSGINRRMLNTCSTHAEQGKEKESKVKEIKEKNIKADMEGKTKRFSPPTLDEIEIYCAERKNKIDANRFFDFYEAKGWMIGKTKMKDWKASVRTWEKEEKQNGYVHPAVDYRTDKIYKDERW